MCVQSVCRSPGCCAPGLLYISFSTTAFFEMLVKRVCLSAGTKSPLYMFLPNKYFILRMILSEYCLAPTVPVLCYPAQSSSFVCLDPFSPMKGNWKQRLQLVRQLDSCFVSSTHPLSHTLIAILSSPISRLPFTCSFMGFFFLFWRGV